MTDVERRPNGRDARGGESEPDGFGTEHNPPARLDDLELLAEVHRVVSLVVNAVRRHRRRIPGVGTPSWWKASDDAKVAALLLLGGSYLLHDPDEAVLARIKQASLDVHAGREKWHTACNHTKCPHTAQRHLARRRAEPGPLAREVDRDAAVRWAAGEGA